jgi:hypothetical protein
VQLFNDDIYVGFLNGYFIHEVNKVATKRWFTIGGKKGNKRKGDKSRINDQSNPTNPPLNCVKLWPPGSVTVYERPVLPEVHKKRQNLI